MCYRLLIALLLLHLCGCGIASLPELPEKDWIDAGGEKNSLSSGTSTKGTSLYDSEKIYSFKDVVYLAMQQSPLVARGSINLSLQQIAKRDAQWRYLPELHLIYVISNNVTKYNEGTQYAGRKYGETEYQLSFSGYFNNPINTFFAVKAQNELEKIAISTQEKAISECIQEIAAIFLTIEFKENTITLLNNLKSTGKKKKEIASVKATYSTDLFNQVSVNEDFEGDVNLRLREAETELRLQRLRLKRLVGVDYSLALNIDAHSVHDVIDTFQPEGMTWQTCWEHTTDSYLLRQQIRLENANILVAWAQYVPNVGININDSPPKGQAQYQEAETDQFLHLTLDFPLLDWGRRLRMAETARANKRLRRLDELERRRDYGLRWQELEQELALARARREQRNRAAANAAQRVRAVEAAYTNGVTDLAAVEAFRQTALENSLAALAADYGVAVAKLRWMHHAAALGDKFLSKPDGGGGEQ